MRTYVLDVDIEQEEDGRWSASIPALAGCATWGYTKQEAMDCLQEAAQAYLEVMLEEHAATLEDLEKKVTTLPENAITVTV